MPIGKNSAGDSTLCYGTDDGAKTTARLFGIEDLRRSFPHVSLPPPHVSSNASLNVSPYSPPYAEGESKKADQGESKGEGGGMKGGGKVVTAEVKVEVEDGPIASALETVARCGGLRPHQVLVRNKSEPAEVKVPKTMLFGADVEVRGR